MMDKLVNIFPALGGRGLTVDDMDLEVSVRNALKWRSIHTVGQLLQLSHTELARVFPNRNLRCYEDVIYCLVRLSEELEGMDAAPDFESVRGIGDVLGGVEMSDKKFNIFQVAGIWKSEEIHTSVIAELINPKSAFHNNGAAFLDKFLQMEKIGVKLSPDELKKAEVKTEVPTDKGRRIDMVISAGSCCLPFEVKIWAGDQDAQLYDYHEFVKTKVRPGQEKLKVYYLTPDGHEPSEWSRRNLSDDEIQILSFKEDILPWLNDCINETQYPADVLEIMKQLRDNIQGQSDTRNRSDLQGFSCWRREDVLDAVYRELLKYDLPWTECTNDYETFTLNKMAFDHVSLEFALRIRKESGDRVQLYLICGITREDGKPDYATAGDYITENEENAGQFKRLLADTFLEDGRTLGVKTGKTTWNRLPKDTRYENLDVEQCCREIAAIFETLRPECRPDSNLSP